MTRVAAIIASAIIFLTSSGTKIDNTHDKYELISRQYSIAQINELDKQIRGHDMDFIKFAMEFRIECMRSTAWGYYAIFALEDEREAYVFMNEYFELVDLIIVDEFMSREAFETFVYDVQDRTAIIQVYHDVNIGLSGSASLFSFHIVKEGCCVVQYEITFDEEEQKGGRKVKTIRFMSDDEITALSDESDFAGTFPFVLKIDK